MGQDYLNEVRDNLNAAASRKQAERKAEARKQFWAKVVVIGLLLTVFTAVILFGDNVANWS